MSVIEASFVKSGLLVDGTLRMVCDVEPRHAQAAFALFHAPGASMALAALKPGATESTPAQPAAPPAAEQKPQATLVAKSPRDRSEAQRAAWDELGPLAKWAVERCQDPNFLAWLASISSRVSRPWTAELAREYILTVCEVESRRALDTDAAAGLACKTAIIKPYGDWLKKQGIA